MKTKTKSKAGGGVNSNKVVKKPVKTGGPNRAMSPCAVNQLGNHLGNPKAVEPLVAGKALPSTLGNQLVNNVGTGGPGRGRKVMGQGTQNQYGPSASNRNEGARSVWDDFPSSK